MVRRQRYVEEPDSLRNKVVEKQPDRRTRRSARGVGATGPVALA